jgi:hypothetical protein
MMYQVICECGKKKRYSKYKVIAKMQAFAFWTLHRGHEKEVVVLSNNRVQSDVCNVGDCQNLAVCAGLCEEHSF